MVNPNLKNLYCLPIFILFYFGLFLINKLVKTNNESYEYRLFFPITLITFLINLLTFIITKEKGFPEKKVFCYGYLFGIIDNLIFFSIIKILINQPVIIILHSITLSIIFIKTLFTIPTFKVSTILGVNLSFTFFFVGLSDVHLRGIARSKFMDAFMITPQVDIYFLLLTFLLILRIYFSVRTEIYNEKLISLSNSFFSFVFSLALFLYNYNLNWNINLICISLAIALPYFCFLRIQQGKSAVIGFIGSSFMFSLVYFFRNKLFNSNLLEQNVLKFHHIIFVTLGILYYCEFYLVFRRIAFTVWFVELIGV